MNDIQITMQIRQAGTLIGVELTDHVIVSVEGYFSLCEQKKHSLMKLLNFEVPFLAP